MPFSVGLSSNGFQALLSYPDDFRFDLVISDLTIGPCYLPFLHKFKYPPLVSVTAYSNPSYLNQLIGGNHYYAYAPHNSFQFDDNMNFWQRLSNFIIHVEEYV